MVLSNVFPSFTWNTDSTEKLGTPGVDKEGTLQVLSGSDLSPLHMPF